MKSGSRSAPQTFGTRTLVGGFGLYIVVSSGSRTQVVDSAPFAAAPDWTNML